MDKELPTTLEAVRGHQLHAALSQCCKYAPVVDQERHCRGLSTWNLSIVIPVASITPHECIASQRFWSIHFHHPANNVEKSYHNLLVQLKPPKLLAPLKIQLEPPKLFAPLRSSSSLPSFLHP
jgi:hypothetical protein